MNRREIQSKNCTFCGITDTITIEHLVPQGFYKQFRKNKNLSDDFYIKIPLCKKCNNEKSKLDDLFRLVSSLSTADKSQESINLVNEQVWRSISYNRKYQEILSRKNINIILENDSEIFQFSTGVFLDEYMSFLVKGILCYDFGWEYEEYKKYSIRSIMVDETCRYKHDSELLPNLYGDWKSRRVGDSIFKYSFVDLRPTKDIIVFLFSFFGYYNVMAALVMQPNSRLWQLEKIQT